MTVPQHQRASEIFSHALFHERRNVDRVFLALHGLQWVLAIALAIGKGPTWQGATPSLSPDLLFAVFFGGFLTLFPAALVTRRSGAAITRHMIAVSQMVWSALLIHLTGGRLETHFHIFGSLAFLAFYRDWRVLATAGGVVALDHVVRGAWWPHSIYGLGTPIGWRGLEHIAWVAFEEAVLIYGCRRGLREMLGMAEREAALEGVNATIEREVRTKTAALEASIDASRRITALTNSVPWELDAQTLTVLYISSQAITVYGQTKMSLVGKPFDWTLVHPDDRERTRRQFEELAAGRAGTSLETEFKVLLPPDGRLIYLRCIVSLHEENGLPKSLRGVTRDITKLKKLELELRHAQKLESVGRLAAGVAHEINTPVQFVSDSVHFVRDATGDLTRLVARYREIVDRLVASGASPSAAEDAAQAEADADLAYAIEHLPKALSRSLEGLERVATIVRSMKEFAHPDQRAMTAIDLNQAIRSTLTIAKHEYKYVADLQADFGDLPLVRCHAGDINQVILNIVVNAAHAIEEVVQGSGERGTITVRTWREGDDVMVSIGDTGGGIPESVHDRVFDPFFTTKEVGKGTGQGLALARTLVVERHQGALTFASAGRTGTVFTIRLPIAGALLAGAAA